MDGAMPAWPRRTDDEPGRREQEIAQVLDEGGAKVLQTGEARKLTRLDAEDFKALPEKLVASMQELADRANAYLAGPTISDRFTDHNERRSWRTAMMGKYGEEIAAYLRSNRLSLNAITKMVLPAQRVTAEFKKIDTPLSLKAADAYASAEKVFELFKDGGYSMRYNQATNDERLDMVRVLSVRLRDYLSSVS